MLFGKNIYTHQYVAHAVVKLWQCGHIRQVNLIEVSYAFRVGLRLASKKTNKSRFMQCTGISLTKKSPYILFQSTAVTFQCTHTTKTTWCILSSVYGIQFLFIYVTVRGHTDSTEDAVVQVAASSPPPFSPFFILRTGRVELQIRWLCRWLYRSGRCWFTYPINLTSTFGRRLIDV